TEWSVDGEMHELLYKVTKGATVFWVGVAVPEGTTDFSRAQIFFHPTVVQNTGKRRTVIADDKDYPEFGGNWKHQPGGGGIHPYVPMRGGQLAAAGRKVPLIAPFTTMAALGTPASNMFGDRPKATLEAVLAAARVDVTGQAGPNSALSALGVSSF